MGIDLIQFGADNTENLLAQDPDRMDNLPFGAILVDSRGQIKKYNGAESAISGRPIGSVIGKNFFDDVAPCTKGHEFQGRFREGVAKGALNTIFEYAFDYKMTATKVRVHMKSAAVGDDVWIFIKRL